MILRLHTYGRRGTACILALLFFTGCEEEITRVELTDNAFSIYGVINPLVDVQALRVFQIDALLELTRPEPIDATVLSTDLDSGQSIAWQDSVVQFQNGTFGHVFWAPFQPIHDHRYLLEVIRSDGVKAEVLTRVPPFSTAEILEHNVDGFFLTQPVLWRDAPHLININVTYFTNVGKFNVNYNLQQTKVNGGQIVTLDFRDDVELIFQMAIFFGIQEVVLDKIEMRVVVTDESWDPPGGTFDADLFSEPGTFSNVVNGFGFVGAGYSASVEWVPEDEVLRELGFFIPGG